MSNSGTDVDPWSDVESMISGSTLCSELPLKKWDIVTWLFPLLAHLCLFQAYYFHCKPISAIVSLGGSLTRGEEIFLGLSIATVYTTGGIAAWLLWSYLKGVLGQMQECLEIQRQTLFISSACCLIIFFLGVLVGAGAAVAGARLYFIVFLIFAAVLAFRFVIYIVVCYGLYFGLLAIFTYEQLAAHGVFLRWPALLEYFQ